jgi:hypothetical protein
VEHSPLNFRSSIGTAKSLSKGTGGIFAKSNKDEDLPFSCHQADGFVNFFVSKAGVENSLFSMRGGIQYERNTPKSRRVTQRKITTGKKALAFSLCSQKGLSEGEGLKF